MDFIYFRLPSLVHDCTLHWSQRMANCTYPEIATIENPSFCSWGCHAKPLHLISQLGGNMYWAARESIPSPYISEWWVQDVGIIIYLCVADEYNSIMMIAWKSPINSHLQHIAPTQTNRQHHSPSIHSIYKNQSKALDVMKTLLYIRWNERWAHQRNETISLNIFHMYS